MNAAVCHDCDHVGPVSVPVDVRPDERRCNCASIETMAWSNATPPYIGVRINRGDPKGERLEWILRLQPVFGGAVRIETCLGVPGRTRVIVNHGTGVDAEHGVGDVAAILSGAGDSPFGGDRVVDIRGREHVGFGRSRGRRRLFTATIVEDTPVGTVLAFDATIANSFAEARERIRGRRGSHLADIAEIREGFDPGLPLVDVLVSAAITEMLEQIAADPNSSLADGLEIAIEQRFAA